MPINSVAFSPDGMKIVSGCCDGTIKVWDAVNFRPHVESEWETLDKKLNTDDSDEEDEADDYSDDEVRFFPDEEDEVETWWRNKITGQEQSVKPSGGERLPWNLRPSGGERLPWNLRRSKSGIWVRRSPQIAPRWPKLTPVGLPGRQTGAAEREDECPQRGSRVGGVFPGWDQDRVRIVGPYDQSLGSGQLVSQRSFDVQSYHTGIRLAAAVAEQIQHEVS
jgi:hypothetical protein